MKFDIIIKKGHNGFARTYQPIVKWGWCHTEECYGCSIIESLEDAQEFIKTNKLEALSKEILEKAADFLKNAELEDDYLKLEFDSTALVDAWAVEVDDFSRYTSLL
jgi:hypothetical protein